MTRNEELQSKVITWAKEKGLLENVTIERAEKQTMKVLEELGETSGAYLKNKREELIDGIGDSAVTIIILARMLGKRLNLDITASSEMSNPIGVIYYVSSSWNWDFFHNEDFLSEAYSALAGFCTHLELDFDHCLETAYNVIAKRTGKMVGDTFIKD